MDDRLSFMRISEKDDIEDIREMVYKDLISDLAGVGDENQGLSDFESYYDFEKTYEFFWKKTSSLCGCLATFVEPEDITEFIRKSKECVEEFGFDPLDPTPPGVEIITNVYVYSPNSFPEKGLRDLLSVPDDKEFHKDVYIFLVSTDEIINKHIDFFDEFE